jgi:hypothetical protein
MTKIIKEITLKEIQLLQNSGNDTVDIAAFTISLQSRIIINISVGMGYSKTLVDWEQDNGQMTQVSIAEALTRLI